MGTIAKVALGGAALVSGGVGALAVGEGGNIALAVPNCCPGSQACPGNGPCLSTENTVANGEWKWKMHYDSEMDQSRMVGALWY